MLGYCSKYSTLAERCMVGDRGVTLARGSVQCFLEHLSFRVVVLVHQEYDLKMTGPRTPPHQIPSHRLLPALSPKDVDDPDSQGRTNKGCSGQGPGEAGSCLQEV